MYGLPRSVWWFIATAIIFVLQWIPVTGIFLMFLMAPFWSVVTVNAGFISLGIEAATGRTARLWLLAPVVWFGGYAIAAQLGERAYLRLDGEIRNENAQSKVVFDPANSVIVITENANDLGDAARRLVQDYPLPVAYSDRRSPKRSQRDQRNRELPSLDLGMRAFRIAGADTCARLRADARLREAHAYGYAIQEKRGTRTTSAALCNYSLPEEPTLPITRVEATGQRLNSLLFDGKIVRIAIIAPDGTRTELKSGQAAPLRWFPMPAMGCALNSGAPSWNCFFGFMKQSPRGLGSEGAWGRATIAVIAAALGLEANSAAGRREALAASDTTGLDRLLTNHEGAAIANLERLLTDPTQRATVHHLAGLAERPGLLAPYADRMLVAMSQALAQGHGTSETARNLQRLIAALPDADFQRVAPDVLRRIDEGRPQGRSVAAPNKRKPARERIDGKLAMRLGDIGAAAQPLLERLALEPSGDSAAHAILGLCRMNEPGNDLAHRLADHIGATTTSTSEARAAAYVTLMRWKRADLAERLFDENGRNRRDYERRWPRLGASPGPEVCTFRIQR